MSLSSSEVKTLEAILDGLEAAGGLNGNSETFVKETRDRYTQWGAGIRLSVKQWDWLKSLYEKNVGSLDAI